MKHPHFMDAGLKEGQWCLNQQGNLAIVMKHIGWDGIGWPRYQVSVWQKDTDKWLEAEESEDRLTPISDEEKERMLRPCSKAVKALEDMIAMVTNSLNPKKDQS